MGKKQKPSTNRSKISRSVDQVKSSSVRWAGFSSKFLSPERAFIILGSIFGLLFLLVIPPFEVPDEPQHFYRAYQVSELGFFRIVELNKDEKPPGNAPSKYGAMLPKSLAVVVDGSEVATIRFQPDRKVQLSKLAALFHLPLDPRNREYLPVAPYPPIAYVPQAIAIALGRIGGLPAVVLFYLGRIFALGAWIALTYLAIRITPILKWTFCLLALMPMTVSLGASISPDSLTFGVSFLLTALLLYWIFDQKKETIGKSDLGLLLLLLIVLTLCKAIYILLIFLFLLIPRKKFDSKGRFYLSFTLALASGVAIYFLWEYVATAIVVPGPTISLLRHAVDNPPFPNVSAQKQIAFILSNPGAFMDILLNTYSVLGGYLLNTFVGLLGWVDTWLPSWVPYAYVASLAVASLLESSGRKITMKARLLSFAIFVAVGFISLVYIYISWNSVGMKYIAGFQGRYLIPVAPVFFLIFQNQRIRWKWLPLLMPALMIFVGVTLSVTTYTLVERFYKETPPTYRIDEIISSKSGDFMIVRGWAIDQTSDNVAAGIEVEIDGKLFQARYGIERPDVVDSLRKPAYRYSGFEAQIPASQFGRGQHSLALRILTRDHKSYVVPERGLGVEIK